MLSGPEEEGSSDTRYNKIGKIQAQGGKNREKRDYKIDYYTLNTIVHIRERLCCDSFSYYIYYLVFYMNLALCSS